MKHTMNNIAVLWLTTAMAVSAQAEKLIPVDESVDGVAVRGYLILPNSGGLYWVTWIEGETRLSDHWQKLDNDYQVHIDGDVHIAELGLFAITISKDRIHYLLYKPQTQKWRYGQNLSNEPYYQLRQIKMFSNAGRYFQDCFLLAVSPKENMKNRWIPSGVHRIMDGSIPSISSDPIPGTYNNPVIGLLQNPVDGTIFYCWSSTDTTSSSSLVFQKIDLNQFTREVSSDFVVEGVKLDQIIEFYQDVEANGKVHQTMLAKAEQAGIASWGLWQRIGAGTALDPVGWSASTLPDVDLSICHGLATRTSLDGDSHIYTFMQNLGFLVIHSKTNQYEILSQDKFGLEFPALSIDAMACVPRGWLKDPALDMVILAITDGSVLAITFNPEHPAETAEMKILRPTTNSPENAFIDHILGNKR
jgi:hypothetical protein